MKKLGVLVFLAMTVILLVGPATAQNVGDESVFFVTYYSNANNVDAPDATLRLINDGDASTSQTAGKANGTLYASIYVFDDSQELQECCNCIITADGLLSESVDNQLTNNTETGKVPRVGVIKVISSASSDPTHNILKSGIRGTMTHIQEASPFAVTETPLADSNLVSPEQAALQQSCSFAITLGMSTGQGICSCTPEGSDF